VAREEEARAAAVIEERQLSEAVRKLMIGAPVRSKDEKPETLDEVMDRLRDYAKTVLSTRGPEDDVIPMLEVIGEERDFIGVVPFSDNVEQEFVLEKLMPAAASAINPRVAVFIHHVFGFPADHEWKEGDTRPRESDASIEFVEIVGTDGLIEKRSVAVVLRTDDQPPALQPFGAEYPDVEYEPFEQESFLAWTTQAVLVSRLARAARIWVQSRPKEWWTFKRREAYGVMDEQIEIGMRDGDDSVHTTPNKASHAAFVSLYLDESGEVDPEVIALSKRPDIWDIKDDIVYTEKPWEVSDGV
jgi:hypothetical protein